VSTSRLKLSEAIEKGQIAWSAPSNIALIKYWGKHGRQLPQNPSLSLTLNSAKTNTILNYEFSSLEDSKTVSVEFFFHATRQEKFEAKIKKYLISLLEEYPFLSQLKIRIDSENTFPHSAGIASSASGMAALALCLTSLEARFFKSFQEGDTAFWRKASHLARLGSGSASRSIYGGAVLWGRTTQIEILKNSNDEFSIPVDEISESIKDIKDAIILVSEKEKAVSSSVGHSLMKNHPYEQARYLEANDNLKKILKAFKENDWRKAGEIIEHEALSLHGLMGTSTPSFILMEPKTLEIIQAIREWRQETGVQVYFTLDAGPNIHMLYKNQDAIVVEAWLRQKWPYYYDNKKILFDEVGIGPTKL